MKKILLCLMISLSILTGCALIKKTPSDAVKSFLEKYTLNDSVVVKELDDYLDAENLDEDTKKAYKEVYLRQYSNMDYEVKDEVINGDEAEVTVLISVYDYYKSSLDSGKYFEEEKDKFLNKDGDIDLAEFLKYKLDMFLKTEDKVSYTLVLNVKKINDNWEVDPLNQEQLSKIHGTYEY